MQGLHMLNKPRSKILEDFPQHRGLLFPLLTSIFIEDLARDKIDKMPRA